MEKLPISLLFLTTTKGHFGVRDIYSRTLKDWRDKGYLDLFQERLAHIKISPEDSNFFEMRGKIEGLYSQNIFSTIKEWAHFQNSHQTGIIEDINKLVRNSSQPYCMILEDDWIPYIYKNSFEYYLKRAIETLEQFKDLVCYRVPRHLDDENHFPGTEKWENFSAQGHLFSNNPCVLRTRDLYMATNLALKNKHLIEQNCEVGMTYIFKQLVNSEKPFAAFLPSEIRALHIGVPTISEEDQP